MKKTAWLLSLFSLVISILGCHTADEVVSPPIPAGAMAYEGYDEQGTLLVRGWVRLDLAVVAAGSTIPVNVTGSWKLWTVSLDGDVGPQIGEGRLEGFLQDGTLFANFNPSRADDNVFADGSFELIGGPLGHMSWEGTWSWNTLAGPRRTGTFRART